VDPVPDPLLLTKSGSAGNLTRISGSVARNSDRIKILKLERSVLSALEPVSVSSVSQYHILELTVTELQLKSTSRSQI
jgi:hypothetical protein